MTPDPEQARRLSSRRIYSGKVLCLDVDEVEEPGDVRAEREIVRHSGSAAVLPVLDDGRVVLIQQYRHGAERRLWEVPAGRLDPGESPAEGAARELEEEVGWRPAELHPLTILYTTPGFCDERIHVFRATGLEAVPPRPDEDERIEPRALPLEEALAMIARGEISDAKTLVALLMEREARR